jgi:hypothetical protein
MSNLPQETIDRINAEADKYGFVVPYNGSKSFYIEDKVKGYLAGATEWAGKAETELIPALNELRVRLYICKDTGKQLDNDNAILLIETALAKYKEASNAKG